MNDENEILRTVVEYCRLLDEHSGRGLADLFTEDATFSHHGADPIRGRDAVEATLSRGTGPLHVAVNPLITVDGDRATGSIDHVLLKRADDGTFDIVAVGRWNDSYVRDADRWRIAERAIEFPHGLPSPRVTPPPESTTE
ncbi:Nuclear transport factor 2 family protein [Frankia sp. Hr75.2]|nr:Nuclear transport factor 2 family protein [Frankia sp. Hr75.2]